LERSSHPEVLAYSLMLIAVGCWASSFIWIKIALRSIPPIGLAAVRFSLASIVLSIVIIPFARIRGESFSRKLLGRFLIIGLLGTFLPSVLQNYGMQYLSAGISGVLQGMGPIYTSILAALALNEHLGSKRILGALIAFGGTFLLSMGLADMGGASILGVALITLSALCYSAYTVVVRKSLLDRIHPLALLTGSTLLGALLLIPTALVVEPTHSLLHLDPSEMGVVLSLVFISTVLGYACYYGALKLIEASRAAGFIFLVPVGALILGRVFLGETLSGPQILFSAIIIAGVAIAETERPSPR